MDLNKSAEQSQSAPTEVKNETTLADAASAGDVQCVCALLDAGADLHEQNDLALCCAAGRGQNEGAQVAD